MNKLITNNVEDCIKFVSVKKKIKNTHKILHQMYKISVQLHSVENDAELQHQQ